MRARDIVGKTVKRVVQERTVTPYGVVYEIHRIEFTNGSLLYFNAVPTEDDPVIEGHVLTARELAKRRAKEAERQINQANGKAGDW